MPEASTTSPVKHAATLLRYLLVGLVNTAVGYGVIVLVTWSGARPTLANLAGYAVGICVSLVLNTRFTFRSGRSLRALLLPFLSQVALAWGLNWLTLQTLLWLATPVLLAQALSMVVYTLSLFALLRWRVFGAASQSTHGKPGTPGTPGTQAT